MRLPHILSQVMSSCCYKLAGDVNMALEFALKCSLYSTRWFPELGAAEGKLSCGVHPVYTQSIGSISNLYTCTPLLLTEVVDSVDNVPYIYHKEL